MSTGLAEVVPSVVAAEERFTDPPDVVLFDVERALLARAVDKRRREFATVRHCARRALAALGHPPVALLPGERGAPQWPVGVVGSMTHCAGYRAAAVAHACDVHTIGIDAEPHVGLPDGVLASIALPQERACLAQLRAAERSVCWDRLLFSAKESLYKAWFPLTRRWLDFEQALITIDPLGHTFSARLLVPGPTVDGRSLQTFRGQWRLHDGLVLTAITVLAQPAAGTADPAPSR